MACSWRFIFFAGTSVWCGCGNLVGADFDEKSLRPGELSSDCAEIGPVEAAMLADATITSGYPDANDGDDTGLGVGWFGGEFRALLAPDMSGLAPFAAVHNAELCVHFSGSSSLAGTKDPTLGVYDVPKPWVEAEVTWLSASQGEPWAAPGGDHGDLLDQMTLDVFATRSWICLDVTARIAQLVEGAAADSGLMLASLDGTSTATTFFDSTEAPTGDGPVLRVTGCTR